MSTASPTVFSAEITTKSSRRSEVRPYPGIAPEANPNTILILTLTLTRGLILDNARGHCCPNCILLNAHSLHTVETCDLAARPMPPHTHYLKTPELRKSHGSSWRWLWGGGPDPRTPLDAAAPESVSSFARELSGDTLITR